jgi:hypothetical protein
MASPRSRYTGPDAPRHQSYDDTLTDETSGQVRQYNPLMPAPATLPIRSGPPSQQSSKSRHIAVEDAISDDKKRRRSSVSSSSSESSSNSSQNRRPPRKRHGHWQPDPNAALAIATNQPLPQANHAQYGTFLYKNAPVQNTREAATRRSDTEELDTLPLQIEVNSPMMHQPAVGVPLHLTNDGS